MRQGNITFIGKSGEPYPFEVLPLQTRFRPVAGVYIVTKRTYSGGAFRRASHDAIFVGRTDNLARSLTEPASLERFAKFGANCVCILLVADPERGQAVEQDLLARHRTRCNQRQWAEGFFAESRDPG